MTPTLIAKVGIFNFLAGPVDFGKKFKGLPILGNHKTWRGVIFGILIGFLVTLLQAWLYQFPTIQKLSFLNYHQINVFLFGFLISSGAIFGDLFFAFIKRRLKLEPGAKFVPFDQINYVILATLFLNPFFKIDMKIWITVLILTFLLHIICNWIGFKLGLRETKW